jgi:fructokinase
MIHVIGEALVDLIVSPDGSISAVTGGGPFNLARAAARLGANVTFAGGISDDAFGQMIRQQLRDDGVSTPVDVRRGLPTTLALASLDKHGSASYTFYTVGTAAATVTADEIAPPPTAEILATGTLGLVMEPVASAIEKVIHDAPEGMIVFVDPNCRPSVITDIGAYRDRVLRVFRRTDIVKVSTEDMEFLCPGEDPRAAAESLRQHGPAVVLLTDGGREVTILHAAGRSTVAVPRIDVVDTVGAGDAFGGAFLAFWRRDGRGRDDLADAAALTSTAEGAVQVSALTCTRQGADPPHLSELQG